MVVLPGGSHLLMADGRRGADVLMARDGDVTEFMLPTGEWVRLDTPPACTLSLGPQ